MDVSCNSLVMSAFISDVTIIKTMQIHSCVKYFDITLPCQSTFYMHMTRYGRMKGKICLRINDMGFVCLH